MSKLMILLAFSITGISMAGQGWAQAPGTSFGIPEGTGTTGVEHFSPAPSAPSTLGSPGSVGVTPMRGFHTGVHARNHARHPHLRR